MTQTDLLPLLSQPFTLALAARHGVGRSVVRRLLRDGDVRRLAHGVYLGSHVEETVLIRARATALVSPPGAVVCGRTAADLHGVRLPLRPRTAARRPAPVEIAVPPGCTPPKRRGCAARRLSLSREEVVCVAGVDVTSPFRTAADLGRVLERNEGVAVLDAFLHAGLVVAGDLSAMAARFTGLPGRRRLAEAVRLADARSACPDETLLRLIVTDAGLHGGETGLELRSALGRPLHRFALAWPAWRVGIDLAPGAGLGIRARVRVLGGSRWLVLDCPTAGLYDNREATIARIGMEVSLRRLAVSRAA